MQKKPKHDWNTLEDYLNVHDSVFKKYIKYFQSPRTYKYAKLTEHYHVLELEAVLNTNKGSLVKVDIEKGITVKKIPGNRPVVKLNNYKYHAYFHKTGINIIRYDSPHGGHNQFHHKHTYGFLGNEIKIDPVRNDDWPHVHEFLDEVIQNF